MTDPVQINPTLLLRGVHNRLADVAPIHQTPEDRRETPTEAAQRIAAAQATRVRLWEPRVPLIYRQASYDDLTYQQNPDRKVSRWWAEGDLTLVLRSDRAGVGKTHGLYAIGNTAVYTHGAWAAAWTAAELNEAFRPGGDGTALDVACECDLLGLDDLGGEKVNEWTLERLLLVFDARNRNRKRTIITTNLAGADLVDRYGDRIVNRLLDLSWTVKIDGESRRRPAPW